MTKKLSFFEKLTGSIRLNDDINDKFEVDINEENEEINHLEVQDDDYEDDIGELSIDMYSTNDAIIIKAMVAGIQKSEIDISLTRDILKIEGSRFDNSDVDLNDYYTQELFWGRFSKIIKLPEEIDIEMAEAHESHGLLILILPLIDKDKETKLKVK